MKSENNRRKITEK